MEMKPNFLLCPETEEIAKMVTITVIVFSFILTKAFSAHVKANTELVTLFYGEDFHILLPSNETEVTFRNRSSPRSGDVALMRRGVSVSSMVKHNKLLRHLIVDAVDEGDEGVYTVKNPDKPDDIRRIILVVRDCSSEDSIKYGDNFRIHLSGVTPPITLEYRPSAVEANLTSSPALVLFTSTNESREGYEGRFSIDSHHITLSAVTGEDKGSYTIRDTGGVIRKKVCLNVKDHQHFVKLPYGKKLKINLILNSSLVQLHFTREGESTAHLLMVKGEFTSAQTELGFENRLSMDGLVVYLDQVKRTDDGVFRVTDLLGFPVSSFHLEVQPYRLESLYVAIIALLGLLVFLLLVCLLSCLIKVKKRAKRAAALEKIAKNAGKEDEGDAFRQVVKNITKLSEESKHSQADNTEKSQSTEVDIKGLEVSSKEVGVGNLETSDSGVGFNTALLLDTDTDAPDQIPDSEAVSISVAPDTKPVSPSATETKPTIPPAMEIKSSPGPETKVSSTPEPKKSPDLPADQKDQKMAALKPTAEVKSSPVLIAEPKVGPSDPKPATSPSPEPKAATPKTTTSPPKIKSAMTPTPEPILITNGTPEPGPDSKPSPDHAELIGGSSMKGGLPKTPETEVKPGSAGEVKIEASKESTLI
ncbi:uncharacterized protein si:dkeyp-77h1.4 [Thalassophryne amazonica]|uniref:uncharacterized protein si:dkeyp-77h1.4 n=1 Tax=Thalassophryne amazonica TaxID=390379 RepID=UPI001471A66A|nr:uncharacterized protein si:dkeyp-77h1.4 [Thalassophryne amazonica]